LTFRAHPEAARHLVTKGKKYDAFFGMSLFNPTHKGHRGPALHRRGRVAKSEKTFGEHTAGVRAW
jgi:hypothetical protein